MKLVYSNINRICFIIQKDVEQIVADKFGRYFIAKEVDQKTEKVTHRAPLQELWDWLRKLPEYKKDYSRQSKLEGFKEYLLSFKNPPSDVLNLKNKWGFYPLYNPSNKFLASFDFLVDVTLVFMKNPPTLAVRLRSSSESELILHIDPTKHISQILDEIKIHVHNVQNHYQIKTNVGPQNPYWDLAYKLFVAENLKWPQKRHSKELELNIPDYSSGNQKDARRKQLERAQEHLESIRKNINSPQKQGRAALLPWTSS